MMYLAFHQNYLKLMNNDRSSSAYKNSEDELMIDHLSPTINAWVPPQSVHIHDRSAVRCRWVCTQGNGTS